MGWVVGILSACFVLASVALTYSARVLASPRLSRWWARLGFYLALTLLICPGAIWLFVLLGGPAAERENRGEATIFFMLPALYPLLYRVLPALLEGIASRPTLLRFLGRLIQAIVAATLLVGLVQIVQQGVLRTVGGMFDQLPSWVLLAFVGLVAILLIALVSHILGWIVGFWLDPVDRKIATYTWGESETQMLGCLATFLISAGLAALYGLVRFVKWAWSG